MSKKKIFIINIFFQKAKKYQIIRPNLKLNRTEILNLCNFWSLPIYVDISNTVNYIRRNKLRYQILPILKIFFNKKIDYALNKHIEIINKENHYFFFIIKEIDKYFQNKKINQDSSNIIWINYLPLTLRYRAYRYLLKKLDQRINFYEIKYLLKK